MGVQLGLSGHCLAALVTFGFEFSRLRALRLGGAPSWISAGLASDNDIVIVPGGTSYDRQLRFGLASQTAPASSGHAEVGLIAVTTAATVG